MDANRAFESFEGHFSELLEQETFSDTQLGNHVRNQNLVWLGVGTQP